MYGLLWSWCNSKCSYGDVQCLCTESTFQILHLSSGQDWKPCIWTFDHLEKGEQMTTIFQHHVSIANATQFCVILFIVCWQQLWLRRVISKRSLPKNYYWAKGLNLQKPVWHNGNFQLSKHSTLTQFDFLTSSLLLSDYFKGMHAISASTLKASATTKKCGRVRLGRSFFSSLLKQEETI